jgi:Protein of unknown function DUF58
MPTREPTFPLVARRRLIGLAFGAINSARRGTGSDVAGSRAYQPGDDVDTIDWNASARLSAARNQDEFVVRERFADEAPRVVIVCDRRPEMALFPPDFPWLSKPAAMRAVGELITASAVAARGYVGYLDFANVEHPDESQRTDPFWRPPNSESQRFRVTDSHLAWPNYYAPHDNLSRAFDFLAGLRGSLPAGTFVFVVSDFLVPPQSQLWMTALERRWDVVPVVIQDPVWEQTFPSVGSLVVPVADAANGGRVRYVRLTRAEARERKGRHERRRAELTRSFDRIGLDSVSVSTSDRAEVFNALLGWAEQRLFNRRRGW